MQVIEKYIVPILFLVVLIGLIIRIVQIESLPRILNRDEAALAYNAYLLKETGRDEWGKTWPLALESFGDFKLPGYVWLLVGLFSVLGLNDGVVRLPAVLAGTALIPLSYFFARRLSFSQLQALVVAAIICFSPVFIFYSRMAFEATVGLSLLVAGIALLIDHDKNQLKFDVLAILCLFLAILTYNTPLLLLPFLLPMVILWRGMFAWKKWLFPLIGIICLGIFGLIVTQSIVKQKKNITLLSDETTLNQYWQYRDRLSSEMKPTLGNRYVFYIPLIVERAIKTFSPKFLVLEGGAHPWHSLAGWGHLVSVVYVFGLVGILASLISLLKWLVGILKKEKPGFIGSTARATLLLYLLGVGLIPSSITVDAPHTTRSLLFILIFCFLAMIGLSESWKKLRHSFGSKGLMMVCLLIGYFWLRESGAYLYDYFVKFPMNQPQGMGVGFDQTIKSVEQLYPRIPIAIVDPDGYQYIELAWYLRLQPQEYFETTIRQLPNQIGFRYGQQVTHYHFIVQATDRDPAEKVLIEWKNNAWNVVQF